MLVLKEDAGHVAGGKRIMVAVGCQLTTVKCLEIMLLAVDLLEQGKAAHALVAGLAVCRGVVVANHVDVEEVLDLPERHYRMVGIVFRTPEVGILAGEGNEVHVVFRAVLGVVGCQRDDGSRTGGIVVGTGIEYLPAEVSQVVVMGGEHVATVVPAALHLGDDIETLVALQELVLDVGRDGFRILWETVGRPENGLVDHFLAIGLVEFQRFLPDVHQACIGACVLALKAPEDIPVLVGEPEIAHHERVFILGHGQVLENLFRLKVQCVDVVEREYPLDARRVLAHGKVYSWRQPLSVDRGFHPAGKRVDVQLERLAHHLVGPYPDKLLPQELSCLVGASPRIAAPLVFGRAQLPHNAFIMRHVLRTQLYGNKYQ